MKQPQQIFNRRLLRLRNSKYPPQATSLHAYVAESLAYRLSFVKRHFKRVLVIGNIERASFPTIIDSHITQIGWGGPACDVAADSEFLPFASHSFDLIISVFDLHNVNDVPGMLLQCRQALQPDGLFLACLLGGETLSELCHTIMLVEEEMRGGVSPRVAPMIRLSDAAALLQRAGFALPVADHDKLHLSFDSVSQLLLMLKKSGLTNIQMAQHQGLMTKTLLEKIEETYQHLYAQQGKVKATFDVIFLSGWAPAPHQPKALKPGSAEVSLIEFLQ